jgi:hypothetical protein
MISSKSEDKLLTAVHNLTKLHINMTRKFPHPNLKYGYLWEKYAESKLKYTEG